MEERIKELEKIVAFQSSEIEDLTGALSEHQKRIDHIEDEIKSIIEKASSDPLVKPIEDEEPPPHY